VRKLAKDLGVDLAALTGSGPAGTITREDVEAAVSGPAAGSAAPAQAARLVLAGDEERIPIRGVRKHTALAVASSAFTAPHVTEFLQIDVTETMSAVQRLRELPEFEGWRPSPLLLVAKALMLAVARHPMINSSWDEAAQEIVVKNTITNVGVFGVDTGTPILTPGEAAILALGQVKEAPWVHEGTLAVRQVTTLALSFDHRVVDGDLGSAVLRDIGAMLTDPVRMIAWA